MVWGGSLFLSNGGRKALLYLRAMSSKLSIVSKVSKRQRSVARSSYYKRLKLKRELNFLLVQIQSKIVKLKEKEHFIQEKVKVKNNCCDADDEASSSEEDFTFLFKKLKLTNSDG